MWVDSEPFKSEEGLAVLVGGPLDGREHAVEPNAGELLVLMTDGARHLYERTSEFQTLPTGRIAIVFRWRGRHDGPV
jgi:hypothetical protein